MKRIEQGDIWYIDFDPSIGHEIKKARPALVLSNSYYNLGSGTVFVVPLTTTKPKQTVEALFVEIPSDNKSHLEKVSYANVSQLRSVSKLRFIEKIGIYSPIVKENITKKFLEILDVDILNLRYF